MYQPSHFVEARPEALARLVAERPLGLLVTFDAGGAPQADVLPWLLEAGGPHGTLRGHVARANPVWREARGEVEALVVFQGAEGYVSPAWYPSKARHGKVVPTWNYVLVQARGRLRVVHDEAWLHGLVDRLTRHFEGLRAATQPAPPPWAVDDAPADYLGSMLRAIVGLEIELTSLVGKFKLSQNREAADRAGVLDALAARAGDAPAQALAEAMRAAQGDPPASA